MWRVVVLLVVMACSKASTDGADTKGSGSQTAAPAAAEDKKSDKSAADVMKASIEAAKARAAAQTPPPTDPPPVPPADPMPPETTAPVAADPLPPETPPAAAEFKVGDRVMAKWDNAKWYPGRIVGIKDGKYDVNYDDGDKSRGLPAHRVRKPAASSSSDRTTTTKSDAPCPGPGLTRRCNGTCVNIQENSNHCGGCNNRCPSGKRCDGHMSCRDADGNL